MDVIIKKSKAFGIINAPSSKSVAHRMIINAFLSDAPVTIKNLNFNDDILATVECLKQLGANIVLEENLCKVFPDKNKIGDRILNCNESGSTLRFLIPIALLFNKKTTFVGTKRLFERPLDEYFFLAKEQGFLWEQGEDSLTVKGQLLSGEYKVKGNVSSQFVSGLLLALSTIEGESKIIITTEIESEPYIDLTLDSLKTFGISAKKENNIISILGGKRKPPKEITVEGDWSNSAYFGALNFLDNSIIIDNLNENSLQGDRFWREIFPQFENSTPTVSVKNCPDLAPILMVLGSIKNGCTLVDTKRLFDKESNRAAAMQTELEKFGVKTLVNENSITVEKGEIHPPKEILFGHNDHRIVMALTIMCTVYGGKINGAEAVNKSFPQFFDLLKSIGIPLKFN